MLWKTANILYNIFGFYLKHQLYRLQRKQTAMIVLAIFGNGKCTGVIFAQLPNCYVISNTEPNLYDLSAHQQNKGQGPAFQSLRNLSLE